MYFHLIYILVPIVITAALYRIFVHKSPYYTYPLSNELARHKHTHHHYHKKILFLLRLIALLGLVFLIARPVWIDERSKVNIEGIDIVLAIDVSDSMNVFDDLRDRRSRIEVAKQEAIRFIEKRIDDPIGIVIFGREVISRCPLTLDKNILKELVGELEIGIVNPQGTWLGTGLATAVNRLRTSKAKSKIIVLLTDGEPTPPEKIEPEVAINLAKQFGIKVYTIGIGNENGGYFAHPFFGVQQVPYSLNVSLLKKIAQETGGMFLKANNPQEMRIAYDTINKLEKTEYQTTLFHRYYEAFLTFIWIILGLLALELMLRLFIWRGV
jgi:Ca-activated chloride channel family protein